MSASLSNSGKNLAGDSNVLLDMNFHLNFHLSNTQAWVRNNTPTQI